MLELHLHHGHHEDDLQDKVKYRPILASIGIGTAIALNLAAAPLTITGPARVIDGNTIVVAGVIVRLKGVDAAELGRRAVRGKR